MNHDTVFQIFVGLILSLIAAIFKLIHGQIKDITGKLEPLIPSDASTKQSMRDLRERLGRLEAWRDRSEENKK